MNRDWYLNPSQGNSRSAHDYGNSGPILPCDEDAYPVSWGERIIVSIITVALTIALVAFWPS